MELTETQAAAGDSGDESPVVEGGTTHDSGDESPVLEQREVNNPVAVATRDVAEGERDSPDAPAPSGPQTTTNPLVYACNSNFLTGLIYCPSHMRSSTTTFMAEFCWRMTTALFAMAASFWLVYMRYAFWAVTLKDPSLIAPMYELLPLSSIYRNPMFHDCWAPTTCIPRHSYCYMLDWTYCSTNTQIDDERWSWEATWCDADCSTWAIRDHGSCGCLTDRADNGTLYYDAPVGKPCYVQEGWNLQKPDCANHTECGPSQYCAACDKCQELFGADLCHEECSDGVGINRTGSCDPLEMCQFMNGGDSMDGECPEGEFVGADTCVRADEASWDPLYSSGRVEDFCPNAQVQDKCLEEVDDAYGWAFVAALLCTFCVALFEQGRKSWLKFTALNSANDEPSRNQGCCTCCARLCQLLVVDIAIPLLMLMAIFILALTRSYPMVQIPKGSKCNPLDDGFSHQECDQLQVTQMSLHSFWFLSWAIACLWHFLFKLALFFWLRRQARNREGAGVMLDMRAYAVLPGDMVVDQVPQRKWRWYDVLFSLLLISGCFLLAIGSMAYGLG